MGDIQSSYSSETSPGSTETLAEDAPLLTAATSPNTDLGYKAITTVTTSERLSNEENGLVEEESFREGDPKSKNVFAIIGLLLIGVFVSNADATLVIATYASISSEFGALKNAAWLTTSYTLAICAVQGIVGKLSDIYGRKAVLLVSYVGFAFGSVLTGMAQSMWQAVAGRVVSGLGGAGMVVIVSVLITDLVPLIEVATWRSYVNVLATLGRSTGGPLGGFLADTVGWRWSFIGQAPLFLLAFVLICLKLPSQLPTQHSQIKGQPSKLRRIDFIGAILLALTIVTFLSALSLGGQDMNWIDPLILSLAAASSVLGSLFILWEIKFAFEPIFPPALVIQRDVATSYAISAFQTGAQVSMLFSVPLYFRITTNASNTQAGAYLFPSVLGNAIGGIIAGYVIRRTAKYKTLIVLATFSSCVSYFLLIVRWHENISVWEVLETFPGGFGTGIVGSGIFIALTSSVEHKDIAMATGGMYLGSAFGMMTGIAVSTSVQLTSLRRLLVERLQGPGSEKIISSVISDISTISSLAEPIQKVVVESYVKSLEYSHVVSFSSAVAAFLLSLTIREHPLR